MSHPFLSSELPQFPPARGNVVPPEGGWELCPLFDPFEAYLGPFFYIFDVKEQLSLGIRIDDRHCEKNGSAALGALMAFADASMGWAVWRAAEDAPGAVTISLHVDCLAPVAFGCFLQTQPEIVRKTRDLVFVRAVYEVDGDAVMTASSLWKLLVA